LADDRLAQLQAVLLELAGKDYAARAPVSAARDDIDAICVGVNLLAEELAYERSERSRAQSLLSDAVDAYEGAPAMFCSVEGAERHIVKCNATMATLLGVAPDALLGRSLPSLSMAPDAMAMALEHVLSKGGETADVFWLQVVGDPVPVRLAAVPVAGTERVQVVLRDARADLRAEEDERERQKMLALAELSGGVAHDLNNLLSVMTMVSSAAREASGDEILELLDDLDVALEGGVGLAQRLLSVSVQGMKRWPVDPSDALRTAARVVRRAAPCEVTVRIDLPDRLPEVAVDPSELERVVINLATNGIEAMPEGGELRIEAGPSDGVVLVRVRDTGVGMDPVTRRRAVEALFTTKPDGTGLGLALAFALCERAGGDLDIQTVAGEGTTVELRLPPPTRGAA
jgi:signal transduction histidine kinase